MSVLESMFSLKGKTAIVTGAAQGIGKVVATRMAEVGADLALMDIQLEKVQQTAKEIAELTGQRVTAYQVDVTKPQQVKEVIAKAAADMGGLDLLFNNAGIVLHKSVYDVEPDEWLRVIDVNMNGVFYMAAEFAKYLRNAKRKGAICNTASMSGHIVNAPQEQASYNVSKAGVIHMTKSLAVEYCKDDIRINCISPGYIYTELTSTVNPDWQEKWMKLTPMGRYGKPEELAGAVIYLLSDCASFATGTDLVVDGGFTLV